MILFMLLRFFDTRKFSLNVAYDFTKKLNLITFTLFFCRAEREPTWSMRSIHWETSEWTMTVIMLSQCLIYELCSKLLAIVFCAMFVPSFVFRPLLHTHSFSCSSCRTIDTDRTRLCVCLCVHKLCSVILNTNFIVKGHLWMQNSKTAMFATSLWFRVTYLHSIWSFNWFLYTK